MPCGWMPRTDPVRFPEHTTGGARQGRFPSGCVVLVADYTSPTGPLSDSGLTDRQGGPAGPDRCPSHGGRSLPGAKGDARNHEFPAGGAVCITHRCRNAAIGQSGFPGGPHVFCL